MNGQLLINSKIGTLAQTPGKSTYVYDAVGNRQQENQPGHAAVTYVSNRLNEYSVVDGSQCGYDLNGNLIDDGDLLYAYNYRNQLVQTRRKSTNIELLRLLYDSIGRLIAVHEGGRTTSLINDGLNVIEEYHGNNVATQYVYEYGIDRRCQMVTSGNEWWIHSDVLSSPRQLSDASGHALVPRYEYEPFGAVINSPGQYNPYRFGGKRLFTAINIYDCRARQYSPKLGRFLQRDPHGIKDGSNLFTFVANNPVSLIDTLGTAKQSLPLDSQEPEFQKARETFRENPFSLEGLKALLFGFMWEISGTATAPDGRILSSKEKQAASVHVSFGFGRKTSRWLVGDKDFSLDDSDCPGRC